MKITEKVSDIRHSPLWAEYLKKIGWQIEKVGTTLLYIRKLPLTHSTIIKIQHAKPPFDFKKIDAIAKKYHALQVTIEPHTLHYHKKPFLQHGYHESKMRYAPTATVKIDISKPEVQVFSSFSENAKRNIKKAQKNDITIKAVLGSAAIKGNAFKTYYKLLSNLRRLKKFYAPGYDESLKKMQALGNNSVLLFAYEKKIPIAVVWLGFYDGAITYLQTGITEQGYTLLANYLLVWEAIRFAKKKKLKVFDFEAMYDPRYPDSNKRWIGYTEFKKRFHGELIFYPPSFVKFYNKPFELLYLFGTFFTK